MRRTRRKGIEKGAKTLVVNDTLTEEEMNNMVTLNEGAQIFSNFRLSPPYLKKTKKNVFALVKQKGTPTFFQSFSVADTKWTWFIAQMYHLKEGSWPTNKDLEDMSWDEKCNLLNSDHVKTSQIFHYMVET